MGLSYLVGVLFDSVQGRGAPPSKVYLSLTVLPSISTGFFIPCLSNIISDTDTLACVPCLALSANRRCASGVVLHDACLRDVEGKQVTSGSHALIESSGVKQALRVKRPAAPSASACIPAFDCSIKDGL